MPAVFRAGGFRPFFCSNEGRPREPVRIHVERGDAEAKSWTEPDVAVAQNAGLNAKTPRELAGLVEANRARIEEARREFFGRADRRRLR